MKRLITGMALLSFAGAALAQGTTVYSPARTLKDQSMSLKSWGSGTISETDELAYEGVYSLRVSTRNFFQGGTINFAQPIDLSGAYADKNNLLRFAVRVADINLVIGGGGTQGGGGAQGGGAGGNTLGNQGERGGAQSGGGTSGTINPDATKLTSLRLIFTTSDGKKSEIYVPITTATVGAKSWITAAAPLQAITGFGATNKSIASISVSGDAISTFYVGDIRVVNDSTPITGEMQPNQDRNLALGDEVEFRASGYGGSSILKYSWDFDSRDGIQNDADGQIVKRRFRSPGDFVVTLTVSDAYGLKKTYSTTIKVKVNP